MHFVYWVKQKVNSKHSSNSKRERQNSVRSTPTRSNTKKESNSTQKQRCLEGLKWAKCVCIVVGCFAHHYTFQDFGDSRWHLTFPTISATIYYQCHSKLHKPSAVIVTMEELYTEQYEIQKKSQPRRLSVVVRYTQNKKHLNWMKWCGIGWYSTKTPEILQHKWNAFELVWEIRI